MQALTPIFDPQFSEHSYGFRPGRTGRHASRTAVCAGGKGLGGGYGRKAVTASQRLTSASSERTLASVQNWIEKHLRLKVNAAKSGTGRVWERKFLGFRLNRQRRIGIAPESLERFKTRVREMWRGHQSRTSEELLDAWLRYVQGWWGYSRLAEDRVALFRLEGWIRRRVRKCFWLRWHHASGRENALRRLGITGRRSKAALTSRGAWSMSLNGSLQSAQSNAVLRQYGFFVPSDLAAQPSR